MINSGEESLVFQQPVRSQSQERSEEPLSASLSKTDTYISVAEARRLLKISHRAMFDLITTSEIGFDIRNQGTPLKYLVRLSDVENFKCKFKQSLSTRSLPRI